MTPQQKIQLDKEEQDLLDSYNHGEWQSLEDTQTNRQYYVDVFKNSMKKDVPISIRLSRQDISRVKAQALREGIPYQTLISSLIHKYASGQIAL